MFFLSHQLLSHLSVMETLASRERGVNIGNDCHHYLGRILAEPRDRTSDLFISPVCYQLSQGEFGAESLTLYYIDTCFNTLATDCFWKHCGKRRNCSSRAISPFPAMFSTQSDNCIPICPYLWHHIFICCWMARPQNWHMKSRVNNFLLPLHLKDGGHISLQLFVCLFAQTQCENKIFLLLLN